MLQSDLPVHLRQRVCSPRGVLLLFVIAVVLVVGVFAVRRYAIHWRQQSALEETTHALDLFRQGDREAAFDLLAQAYRRDSSNPVIWRAWAQTLSDWREPDYERAHYFWRQLDASGQASDEDRLQLGICAAYLGRLDEAQKILDKFHGNAHLRRWTLELQSDLLRARGQTSLADDKMAEALSNAPDDAESQLRLAIINLRAPFDEVRAAAARQLWTLVKQQGPFSGVAMKALAGQTTLTPQETEDLLQCLKQQKTVPQDVRLSVLQAYLARHPEQKPTIIADEMQRFSGLTERESLHFLAWLGLVGEHERLLAKVQREKALLSPELCPIYLDSLAALKRWRELQDTLHQQSNLPLAALDFALLQARCSRGLNESEKLVQTSLEEAVREATASHQAGKLERVALTSESFGYQDLAIQCLQTMTGNPQYEVGALQRILQMQLHGGKTSDALRTVQRILEARPGLHPFVEEELYLKLLLGLEIESATALADHLGASEKEKSLRVFLQALGAFRQADLEKASQAAQEVNPVWLSSGQRAVLAGLLAACGVNDRAFSIAEKISESLLLDEERKFLQKAL